MSLEFKRIVSLRLSVFILKQNIPHFFSTVDINHYRDYTKRKTYLLESNIIQLEKKMALVGFVRSMKIVFRKFIAIEEKLNGSEVLVHVQ